jgi:hypothetical protein
MSQPAPVLVPASAPTGITFGIRGSVFISMHGRGEQRVRIGEHRTLGPTRMPDAQDAALRGAGIEALLDSGQLQLDDALTPLRCRRSLRDGLTGPPPQLFPI